MSEIRKERLGPPRRPKSDFDQCGFTIIEVLVVIAILGVIAALIYPAFAASKSATNKTMCVSNLRQIGVALNLYAESNGECFPPSQQGNSNESKSFRTWVDFVGFDPDQLRCPSARKFQEVPSRFNTGYCLNEHLQRYENGAGKKVINFGIPWSQVERHSESVVVAECSVAAVSILSPERPDIMYLYSAVNEYASLAKGPNYAGFRHSDGANYLFGDIHVKWFTPDAFKSDQYPTFNAQGKKG